MACFVVPGAEAVVVTAAYFVAKKREQKLELLKLDNTARYETAEPRITWSKRLGWLLALLWGGVLLLAFEHFWHGEVVPFPPFLTAMSSPEDTAEMLAEMGSVGVSMAVTVTAVWGLICAVAEAKVRKLRTALKKNAA
ncbi:MAG: hypothetical protein IJU01_05325 [Lachnospiraceae bacterium]|nr:hypothetical protein [Lachnospiraceae bacterium]